MFWLADTLTGARCERAGLFEEWERERTAGRRRARQAWAKAFASVRHAVSNRVAGLTVPANVELPPRKRAA